MLKEYPITNRSVCSWYDYEFTKEILRLAGLKTTVTPITSDQYPQEAKRPHYSVSDNYHLRLLSMDNTCGVGKKPSETT